MPFEAPGEPALPAAGALLNAEECTITSSTCQDKFGTVGTGPLWECGLGSYGRRRHRIRRTTRRRRKPKAARYSRFFLYWEKEKAPSWLAGRFAGARRGRKRGTARAYSSNEAPW